MTAAKVIPHSRCRVHFSELNGAYRASSARGSPFGARVVVRIHGIFLYVSTDQVRFYRTSASDQGDRPWGGIPRDARPLPLTEVSALPFSEVMRDVDLFVGVASVGNDPTWADRGENDQYYGYWQSFSVGELGATATTRKQVLESLLPTLKIADRCSFSDRFLIVRGDLRTYKIHLGSSNS